MSWQKVSFNVFIYFQCTFSSSTKTRFWLDIKENVTENIAILTIKLRNFVLNGLYNFLNKTYLSQNNNKCINIRDSLTQISLYSMNVEIAILKIN